MNNPLGATSYLVTLNPSATPIVQVMALMACRSNNRKQASKLSLSEFKEYFDRHYGEREDMKCEINHNFISIDRRIDSRWTNLIFIQEVDMFESLDEDDAE